MGSPHSENLPLVWSQMDWLTWRNQSLWPGRFGDVLASFLGSCQIAHVSYSHLLRWAGYSPWSFPHSFIRIWKVNCQSWHGFYIKTQSLCTCIHVRKWFLESDIVHLITQLISNFLGWLIWIQEFIQAYFIDLDMISFIITMMSYSDSSNSSCWHKIANGDVLQVSFYFRNHYPPSIFFHLSSQKSPSFPLAFSYQVLVPETESVHFQ